MPTPSARSAARALAVLDYFTTNPSRAFTLSELSAAVGVSLSSLTAVLQALVDSGYLVRHARHKTYELGPALVPLGQAAAARHPIVELARPELVRLAQEHDSECVGSVLVGHEIVILALEGRPSHRTRGLTVGQRIPHVPPLGEIWLAYSGDDAVRGWLRRRGTAACDDHERTFAHLQEAVAQVRARGYAVNLASDRLRAYHEALNLLRRRPASSTLQHRVNELVNALGADYELLDEHPDAHYEVEMVVVPVFGADGSVVFAITLIGLADRSGNEIACIAEGLVATSLALTRAIGGRLPTSENAQIGS